MIGLTWWWRVFGPPFLPLLLSCTCHALAARKYWRVISEINPNISSAASLWLEPTPSLSWLLIFPLSSGFLSVVFSFFFFFFNLLNFISLVLFMFFLRLVSYWVDYFLALQPSLIWVYDMCDFYIINDPGFAMITHLRAAAQNGWCLHYFYSICWFLAIQSHWFVVRWLITYVLLHFCVCACPSSLWLESFISAICSGHGCMTQEETFLDL